MGESYPSLLDLMRLHVHALYTHDARERIEAINEWCGGVAPRFYLGRTAEGHLCRARADVPRALAEDLEGLCRGEPVTRELAEMPAHHDEYVRLLEAHAPIDEVRAGPAYEFPLNLKPRVAATPIDANNSYLLSCGMEDWVPDVPYAQPFLAIVEDGHAVSVCASVRITEEAHEAGVETLPAYRRQGHAVNAVAGWVAAVRKMGAVPFYSTPWENDASQGVAERLGLTLIGVDFHIR